MTPRKWLTAGMIVCCPATARADEPPKPAESRVTAVTVYQGTPWSPVRSTCRKARGWPRSSSHPCRRRPSTARSTPRGPKGSASSAPDTESEWSRRTRARRSASRRSKSASSKLDAERLQKEIKVGEQNLQLLDKLETFTGASLQHLTEKGLFKSVETIGLADYVMDSRAELSAVQVALQQKIQGNTEATEFASRELAELTSGSSRTERDAVIVVDRAGAAGKVRLNYLVADASWKPQYRLRAGAEKDPVQVEYLAAVEQQTGEDWNGVDMTLSTAQPQLNATPPELLALDITVVGRNAMTANMPQQPQGGGMMAARAGWAAGWDSLGTVRCSATSPATCARRPSKS